MSEEPVGPALFAGLVQDEDGNPVEMVLVGRVPNYVVIVDGFRRHVEARAVDRQVLNVVRDLFLENREITTEAMMEMLGKDDLFTKAMIDASVKNMEQVLSVGLPEEHRAWLGMLGFRVIINAHGEVVDVHFPEQEDTSDE